MELMHGWMLWIWLGVLAVAAIVGVVFAVRDGRVGRDAVRIAHRERLLRLPAYRRARGRLRLGLVVALAVAIVGVVSAAFLSTRVVAVQKHTIEQNNRDIVLCLDTSGSMTEYDAAILESFGELVEKFDGERIGLTIFNASAVTYFPLTTDYDYVAAQMDDLRENMEDPDTDYAYTDGTLLGDGSSLIGDGLASCVSRFDHLDEERSRSIVFATDNYVAGKQLVSLPEAGKYAEDYGVVVYGLNPGDANGKNYVAELAAEFRDTVESTGGEYYAMDDPDAVPGIVESIEKQEATTLEGPTQIIRTDEPEPLLWLALVATLALLTVSWRLRR